MKAYLYSPYFPNHFGGGEKYLLDFALNLKSFGFDCIDVAISERQHLSSLSLTEFKNKYQQHFSYDLSQINFVGTPLGSSASWLNKVLWTKRYDLGFYLSDGSLFFSAAKRNILHLQIPMRLDKSSLIERAKLKTWHKISTNSQFTRSIIEPSWKVVVDVVHQPLIEVEQIIKQTTFQKKKTIILNVGRFFSQLHSKRQDILVTIFRRLRARYPQETKNWRLVLVGPVEDESYLKKVRSLAIGLPVDFIHDLKRNELLELYQASTIYWHATGYRVNEECEPAKVEHFGISTVEAMAAGNLPIVIAKGGQTEILGKELLLWSWLTQEDCIRHTIKAIRHPELLLRDQQIAQNRAMLFGQKTYLSKMKQLLST